jgi:hypothetical protein
MNDAMGVSSPARYLSFGADRSPEDCHPTRVHIGTKCLFAAANVLKGTHITQPSFVVAHQERALWPVI